MKLTLRFRGDLASNGTATDKHMIRQMLREQLAVHWEQDSRLKEINKDLKSLQIAAKKADKFVVDRPIVGVKNFFWRYPIRGYDYIPLATNIHEFHCHLDIRIYRKKEEGGILFEGGDIDNRLKTFFDALQVPFHDEQAIQADNASDNPSDWQPMFCLFDNHKALTRVV